MNDGEFRWGGPAWDFDVVDEEDKDMSDAMDPRHASGRETATPLRASKAKLLVEWTNDKETYRLIAVAVHTPGYEDEYVIEQLGQNALGEPSWHHITAWKARDSSSQIANHLVAAIKSLLADERQRP